MYRREILRIGILAFLLLFLVGGRASTSWAQTSVAATPPSPIPPPATSTTPSTGPAIVLGAVLGLTASVLTTFITNHYNSKRQERQWQEERAIREEQWEKENRTRFHVERVQAYTDCLVAAFNIIAAGPSKTLWAEFYRGFYHTSVIATPNVKHKAEAVFRALNRFGDETDGSKKETLRDEAHKAIQDFTDAAQPELNVIPGAIRLTERL